jgi:hypothetical protein
MRRRGEDMSLREKARTVKVKSVMNYEFKTKARKEKGRKNSGFEVRGDKDLLGEMDR